MYDDVALAIGDDRFSFVFDNRDKLDTVAHDVARSGLVFYEIPVPTVLAAIVRSGTGTFIDVGANTGIYSLLAAAARPSVAVVAFEPVPSIRARLERNLAINPTLSSQITIEPIALSNRDGVFMMNEHVNDRGLIATGSTLEATHSDDNGSYRSIPVDLATFDSWAGRHGDMQIDLMKVDVESHEKAFFKGARTTLTKHRPLMIVELLGHADFNYFADFLEEERYADIALFPGRAEIRQRPEFLSEAWNHLFCPQERLWEIARLCNLIGLPIA